MDKLRKVIGIFLSLSFGAAAVLYTIAYVDVTFRLAYWATRSDYPNIDPRITYVLALFGFVAAALISGLVELLRTWVFERRLLLWWQLIAVGAPYPIFFSGLALRHVLEPQLAFQLCIVLALLINPLTVYFLFNGYSQGASKISTPQ